MATRVLTFSCQGGQCTVDYPVEHVNEGDTLQFNNQTAGDLQVWNLPSSIFVDPSQFQIPAASTQDKVIKDDAPLHTEFSYDYKCLACPGDNDQGKIIVDD